MANDLANNRTLGRTAQILALMVFLPIVTLYPAFLGARVASGLGRERAAQTLMTLLTLPIERSAILKAIAHAILLRDRGLYWILGGTIALGVVTGGVDWLGAIASAILMFGCMAWAIAFGLWLSVHVEMPARASMICVAVWGGLMLLPWFVAPFVGVAWRDTVELASPPNGIFEALTTGRTKLEHDRSPVLFALATGVALFGLAVLFAWHARISFEREGK